MPHTHIVTDDDLYFTIDPSTRIISNLSGNTFSLMQGDHNSEEFTFELPRKIEDHDMLECDVIQVHYTNTGTGTSASTREKNEGLIEIKNLKVNPDNEETLICTWLISQEATRFAGSLKFQLKFKCTDSVDTTSFSYIWNTRPFDGVTILAGIDNTESVVTKHADVLEQWRQILFSGGGGGGTGTVTPSTISITSMSITPSVAEVGSTVRNPSVSWAVNGTPTVQVLGEESIDVSLRSKVLSGTFTHTNNPQVTLTVTDTYNTSATRSVQIGFMNGVYYGVSAVPSEYNSEFILGLTKTLRTSKLTSFSVDAGAGEHIYYCIPARFGSCTFAVGGFEGGFSLVDTIDFTNASGYTESYYIYRSDNYGLGSLTVTVS